MTSWTIPLFFLLLTACSGKPSSGSATPGLETEDTAGGSSVTTEPTVCTESSSEPNACECSSEEGFTTYRFVQDGTERCMTEFIDPPTASERLPLVMLPDCYTANALQNPGEIVGMARTYNVRIMELSSPTGGWAFPLDNEINESNHTEQCDAESSPEIAYMEAVFSRVDQMIEAGSVDADKIYLSGFSQNSMFSVFVATCFPERIRGISQGGSGLYSEADGSLALPNCEGACTASDFEVHEMDCVTETPCDTCNYFPVLPTSGGESFRSCSVMYDNDDAAHSTAVPGHKLLTQAGHDVTLRIFAARPEAQLGGHTMPVLDWEWANSCLEVNPPCSTECGTAVTGCVEDFKETFRIDNGGQEAMQSREGRDALTNAYRDCHRDNAELCPRGCAATTDMLHSVEVPACECTPGQMDCACTTSDVAGSCPPV